MWFCLLTALSRIAADRALSQAGRTLRRPELAVLHVRAGAVGHARTRRVVFAVGSVESAHAAALWRRGDCGRHGLVFRRDLWNLRPRSTAHRRCQPGRRASRAALDRSPCRANHGTSSILANGFSSIPTCIAIIKYRSGPKKWRRPGASKLFACSRPDPDLVMSDSRVATPSGLEWYPLVPRATGHMADRGKMSFTEKPFRGSASTWLIVSRCQDARQSARADASPSGPVPCSIWWRQEKPGATSRRRARCGRPGTSTRSPISMLIIMLVAERAGHAAAAGVDQLHFGAGNQRQRGRVSATPTSAF